MRKTTYLRSAVAFAVLASAAVLPVHAQTPAEAMGGMSSGSQGAFAGYVPSARLGMQAGIQTPAGNGTAATGKPAAAGQPDEMPPLSDGTTVNRDKVDGFNASIESQFPMTPEMTRRYREIFEQNERAVRERAEPEARIDASFVSLEPGEAPSRIFVSPGVASVVGFYDNTGQPWPITQYVLGSGSEFQALQLTETSNSIVLTPLVRFGWTNLIVALEGQPKPVAMRIEVSSDVVNDRHDVSVMASGPNALMNTAAVPRMATEAGSRELLSALTGVDMPQGSRSVQVAGVDARAWAVGESLYVRSRHALLSPSPMSAMSGPDGVRVYEIGLSPVALFSVDGRIVRADIELP